MPGSPFSVTLGIVDWDFYFSLNDIQNNGFGVTEISTFESVPSPTAGDEFIVKIDPRNNFNQIFTYFEDYDSYFLLNYFKKDNCRFRESEYTHCVFYSYSKDFCN